MSQIDCVACLYMVLWFSLSCTIAILNKYLFLNLDFVFPLSLTCYHMFGQALLAKLLLSTIMKTSHMPVPRDDYIRKILPVATILAVEISFNNLGLRYIPVSFVQTVRSLTPVCAAVVSRITLGKRLSENATLSLIPISLGVGLSTIEELSFHFGGFCATVISCFLTAGKLALSSVLMGDTLKLNPVSALGLMSPVGFVLLLPLSAILEGRDVVEWFSKHRLAGAESLTVFSSAFLAMALNLAIFLLLRRTNAVAVAVAGNLKVVITIVVSVLIFRNPVTKLGVVGCAIALVGCTAYGFVKDKFIS